MAVTACNKQVVSPAPAPADKQTGNISVSVSPELTKAASHRAGETQVRSLQVFVFDSQGLLETDKYDDTGLKTLTLTTLTGNKHIWALVNAPRLSLEKDTPESSFTQTVSFLSDNQFSGSDASQSGLVMVGAYGATQVPGAQQGALNPATKTITPYVVGSNAPDLVPINVYRLGARISLNQVTVQFKGTSLEQASYFKIADIYLKNVVNGLYIDGTNVEVVENADFWTNCITDHSTTANPNGNFYTDKGSTARHGDLSYLLCDKGLSLSTSNVKGGTITVNRDWYVYPNTCTSDNTSSSWSARYTRLVIHAVIPLSDGTPKDTYYVFPIPPASVNTESPTQILSNHTYDINNITVTMFGKDHDNDDALSETGKIQVSVTISNWTNEYSFTYEI